MESNKKVLTAEEKERLIKQKSKVVKENQIVKK